MLESSRRKAWKRDVEREGKRSLETPTVSGKKGWAGRGVSLGLRVELARARLPQGV